MYTENFVIIESDGLVLTEMTEGAARSIFRWRYGGPYSMYDFDGSDEELRQVMNGLHFPVYESGGFSQNDRSIIVDPIGFVAVGPVAQVLSFKSKKIFAKKNSTDVAMGLRPDLCGKGEGLGVRITGLAVNFALQEFPEDGVRLSVTADNERAIRVYEKCGFVQTAKFIARVSANGKKVFKKFLVMEC